jgi:protease-4
MSADAVEAVAKGRVWTGAEAKEKGLVDALGGYDVALRLAKEAAKIPADKPFKLAVFPREKGTIERIFDRLEDRDNDPAPTAVQSMAADAFNVLAGVAALAREPGALQMAPIGEIR